MTTVPAQRPASEGPVCSDISLTAFGLSADADRLWHVLLRWPDLDCGDMCARAGVDRAQAEAAVAELMDHGCVEPWTSALGVAAVDPRISIEHAVSVEQRELSARLSQLSDLRTHLPALGEHYARGRQRVDRELPIEVVDGIEATRQRLRQLQTSARAETLSMMVQSRHGMNAALPGDLALLGRGMSSRSIIQRDELDGEDLFRYYTTLAAAGEQIRVVDRVPGRVFVQDNDVAVLPLDASDLYRGALFIREKMIIDLCIFLFERLWQDATPLFEVQAPDAPTGRSVRVLELMAAGRKDEAIARSLGVGVRTVRRDVAELMAQLGEHTRAATIAAAIRRGWLSA